MNPATLTPTPCETCDHVHPDTRSRPPYAWRCMKFPIMPGLSAVAPNYRPDPPFGKCENINHGYCPTWAPKREAV